MHRAVGIVTAFCLMITLSITLVGAVAYWTPSYFKKEYVKYNVLDSLPSIAMDSLLHITGGVMDYLREGGDDLHVITTMGGEQRGFFNECEITHTEDVQVLLLKALPTRRTCLILGAGPLILMTVARARMGRVLPPSLCMGTGLFFGLITVFGLIISTDFAKYFILFYHTFFTDDLWIPDPAAGMLISIVPGRFFMDTVVRIALLFGSLFLVLSGVCLLPTMRSRGKRG